MKSMIIIESKRVIDEQLSCIGRQVSDNDTKTLLALFVQLQMYKSYNSMS